MKKQFLPPGDETSLKWHLLGALSRLLFFSALGFAMLPLRLIPSPHVLCSSASPVLSLQISQNFNSRKLPYAEYHSLLGTGDAGLLPCAGSRGGGYPILPYRAGLCTCRDLRYTPVLLAFASGFGVALTLPSEHSPAPWQSLALSKPILTAPHLKPVSISLILTVSPVEVQRAWALKASEPQLHSGLHNLLAVWPWAHYLPSLCPSFLIYNMGIIVVLTHRVVVKMKWMTTGKYILINQLTVNTEWMLVCSFYCPVSLLPE